MAPKRGANRLTVSGKVLLLITEKIRHWHQQRVAARIGRALSQPKAWNESTKSPHR